jgi:membrane carboxypeptidase/penicillin-binding protein
LRRDTSCWWRAGEDWALAQLPEVQGALVALDPATERSPR